MSLDKENSRSTPTPKTKRATKLRQVGGSLGVILPLAVLHTLGFREGDMLSATPQLDGNRIVLERIAPPA